MQTSCFSELSFCGKSFNFPPKRRNIFLSPFVRPRRCPRRLLMSTPNKYTCRFEEACKFTAEGRSASQEMTTHMTKHKRNTVKLVKKWKEMAGKWTALATVREFWNDHLNWLSEIVHLLTPWLDQDRPTELFMIAYLSGMRVSFLFLKNTVHTYLPLLLSDLAKYKEVPASRQPRRRKKVTGMYSDTYVGLGLTRIYHQLILFVLMFILTVTSQYCRYSTGLCRLFCTRLYWSVVAWSSPKIWTWLIWQLSYVSVQKMFHAVYPCARVTLAPTCFFWFLAVFEFFD